METLLRLIKSIIPKSLLHFFQPPYHYMFALLGALIYRFPSRSIPVVGITGTKGKSSTAELVNAILEEKGFKTALASTLRFKIGELSEPNLFKMTVPGYFFVQKFLRKAVNDNCTYVILEMTSEAVKQFRHKFVYLDALIFTNLSPEHIEAHGSFEEYKKAKLKLVYSLAHSPKKKRTIVANVDDEHGKDFLDTCVEHIEQKVPYSLRDAAPHTVHKNGISLMFENILITSPLNGTFNLYNILAAASFSRSIGIDTKAIKRGIEKITIIPGRVEHISEGQSFDVIVDYAHTPDSLTKLYQTFRGRSKICVLGNTGGGRDKWKRPLMGSIADRYCKTIILTNEDPYDEDPKTIVDEMARGIKKHRPRIIMDRRKAIAEALKEAKKNDVVLITGKGTDPFIMGKKGGKEPWSDADVAREELRVILAARSPHNPPVRIPQVRQDESI